MSLDHRLIRALKRLPVDRTPIWIMRQAGRYLPEYRAVRKKAGDFLTLCKTPELAAEVTLQPIKRYPLDAAIIFSDILTIPDALGLGLHFKTGEGPHFLRPIRTESAVQALPIIDPERDLSYVMEAIRLVKADLANKIPLIGFAGSPWTVATYMVEGQSSKQFAIIKKMRYQNPKLLHQLLTHLTHITIDYLKAQIAAGADVIMLFDTWGGVLGTSDYLEFSLHYMREIVAAVKKSSPNQEEIPVILFTKNGGKYLSQIADTGCHGIGLDWTADILLACEQIGDRVALQGNLDPAILYADAKTIENEVAKVLQAFGGGEGHIFNLGHGIHADIDPQKVTILCESVHSLSYRGK
jgi:uroporphyrinogen decarboxylase